MGKKTKSIIYKKITRRSFIKKGVLGLAGLSLSAYALNKFLDKGSVEVFQGSAPETLWKWSKECYNYERIGSNVQCLNCPHMCILKPGDRSFCRSKVNLDGKLYSLSYGNPCAVHVDPIEKKPLYHFLPTSLAFSIASAGCVLRCKNCQNAAISQSRPEDTKNYDLMPNNVVEAALHNSCKSIAYTYSEPISFYEYTYDTSKIARKKNIRNLLITSGYINQKPLDDLCKVLDAANVDLKSFKDDIYRNLNSGTLQPVLDSLKTLHKNNVWFEITNLVIPSWTDDLDMIRDMSVWIVKNLGPDYPLHFSRFHPLHKLTHLPQTSVNILEKARKVALDTGIKFVYLGNVAGHEASNTYCPSCEKVIIRRKGYSTELIGLQDGFCKFCGEKIAGVWE